VTLLFLILLLSLSSKLFAADINFNDGEDLVESYLSESLQPETHSIAVLGQIGSNNEIAAYQSGQNNQIQISQSGDLNEVIAFQYGDNNYLNINQNGDNNRADIYQFGSYNTANIEQSGNQYFLLEQYGDFGVVNIIQF